MLLTITDAFVPTVGSECIARNLHRLAPKGNTGARKDRNVPYTLTEPPFVYAR